MAEKIESDKAIDIIAESEPMATVYRHLISGEFAPAPEAEVEKGEVVIGELTRFEKAMWSAKAEIADAHNNKPIKDRDAYSSSLEQAMHSAVSELFWASIRKHLGKAAYNGRGIGLRNGYKIALIPEEEVDGKCGCEVYEVHSPEELMTLMGIK